jgi:hypothetical protein
MRFKFKKENFFDIVLEYPVFFPKSLEDECPGSQNGTNLDLLWFDLPLFSL